jgi:hypothetical protein
MTRDDETRTGAVAQAAAAPQSDPKSHMGLLVVGALAAVGLGTWRYLANTARLEKEQQRFGALEQRADRARMAARIRELMVQEHHSEDDAAAIAAHEALVRAEAEEHMLCPSDEGSPPRASPWLAQPRSL